MIINKALLRLALGFAIAAENARKEEQAKEQNNGEGDAHDSQDHNQAPPNTQ